MLLLVATDAYLQVKYNISAIGFSSAPNNCLTILSSLSTLPETGPFTLIFCLLGVAAFPSQVLPPAAKLSSCCWGKLPYLLGRNTAWILLQRAGHTSRVCVIPKESGAACGAWGSHGQGCWIHFSLGIGILPWMLHSLHWYKICAALGRLSELFNVIINQMLLVTTIYITCFSLSTFTDLYKKKSLTI